MNNFLARAPSTFALWREWGARGGGAVWPLPAGEVSLSFVESTYFHVILQVGEEELGGSVRSASVLSHYRGACSQHQVDFDAITI